MDGTAAAAVDIFAPEYADTEFRMARVQALADQLGKLFGIKGPYVLKFDKQTIDTWTFDIGGKPYTIDVAMYAAIATGKIRPQALADQMLVSRQVATQLCHLVTHLERTASVRAMAMQMEWARIKRAQALEARRQQILADDDGPELRQNGSPASPAHGSGRKTKPAREQEASRAGDPTGVARPH